MNELYNIAIIDDETEILRMLEKYLNKTKKYKVTTFQILLRP
jgi:DNA-binding NtrC family response regulator